MPKQPATTPKQSRFELIQEEKQPTEALPGKPVATSEPVSTRKIAEALVDGAVSALRGALDGAILSQFESDVSSPRQSETTDGATDPATLKDKFLFALANLFGGSQSKMASEIGCSQAAVSKVVTGKRAVGAPLIEMLSRHRRVNPAWLYENAEPKFYPDDGICGLRLPAVVAFPRGHIKNNKMLTLKRWLPVAEYHNHPGGYWYLVPAFRLTPYWHDNCGLRTGDQLLFWPTDYRTQPGYTRPTEGQYCVVECLEENGENFHTKLAKIELVESGRNVLVRFVGDPEVSVAEDPLSVRSSDPAGSHRSYSSAPKIHRVEDLAILAVCRHLSRDFGPIKDESIGVWTAHAD